MTRPTSRVLALLEILQSGGLRSVGDLAVRLDVDERTVRRYAAHLADLGIPVLSVRGRYGGYRLAPGHRMPPLMLTEEEALAVVLGLVAGRRAGLVTTSAAAAESAAAKLRRVLPEPLRQRLDALLEAADFTAQDRGVVELDATVLLLLAGAVRDHRPVRLSYASPAGRQSQRTLHPYGLVSHAGRWYLAGADSASGETRTFRLDRVTTAELQPGSFTVPDGYDAAGQVLAGLAEAPHRHTVSVRVQGTTAQVEARVPLGLVTVEEITDGHGWVRVRLHAERLDWVPGVLAGLGLPFAVERPEALRGLVSALADRLTAAAAPDQPREVVPPTA